MKRSALKRSTGAILLTLAGCGSYPQPFAGNPGRTAAQLALPPPPRLVVVPPAGSLLGEANAAAFARDLAGALADRSVPAIAGAARTPEWRLTIAADRGPAGVSPTYTVTNPKGVAQGSAAGAPISPSSWSAPTDAGMQRIAASDAPAIAALLDRIKAGIQQSDPNSLVNRPARILMQGVTGAPGDGNTALRRLITADLADLGIVVQNTPRGADYALAGTVLVVPAGDAGASLPADGTSRPAGNAGKSRPAGTAGQSGPAGNAGKSRVEIQWTVRDPYGAEAGHLLQMNEIPEHSLDRHWADVAVEVAREAAAGVREVLTNQLAAGSRDRPRLRPPAGAGG